MDHAQLAAEAGAATAARNIAKKSHDFSEEAELRRGRPAGAGLPPYGSERQDVGFGGGAHGNPREKKRKYERAMNHWVPQK